MRGIHALQPLAVLVLAAFAFMAACSDDPNDPAPERGPEIVGSHVGTSDCLLKVEDEDSPFPQDRGFLFWSYDTDAGTLSIEHVNAALNCCPEFTATIGLSDGVVSIVEDETVGMCGCLCLFRISFELNDVPVGVYQVTVDEEYLAEEDPPLAGVIDLTQAEFGTIQAPRSHYPWNTGD